MSGLYTVYGLCSANVVGVASGFWFLVASSLSTWRYLNDLLQRRPRPTLFVDRNIFSRNLARTLILKLGTGCAHLGLEHGCPRTGQSYLPTHVRYVDALASGHMLCFRDCLWDLHHRNPSVYEFVAWGFLLLFFLSFFFPISF